MTGSSDITSNNYTTSKVFVGNSKVCAQGSGYDRIYIMLTFQLLSNLHTLLIKLVN